MTKLATVELLKGSPRVFLATPSYDGKTSQPYTVSLAHSMVKLQEAGFGVTYCLMGGNCHVDDARNGLVREFLMSDCDDLVFLDADVGWSGDDLVRLLHFSKTMVAGVYPKRSPVGEEYPVSAFENREPDAEGLVEVAAVPTGFLRINRSVIERLMETHGQRQFAGQGARPGDTPYTILFERTYEDGSRWSGDYAFCRKWASTGGKIYVAPEMQFIHEGTAEWAGNLADFWARESGEDAHIKQAKFDTALQAVRDGSHTGEHLMDLVVGWGNPWSGEPELLETCIALAKEARGPILEMGSGLSTLLMAAVAGQPVIALENSPIWATYTQAMLDKHGVKAELRCAPLVDLGWCEWYAETPDTLPEGIAVAICDGPVRKTKGGRTGLATIAYAIKDAVIVLDDPSTPTIMAIQQAMEPWGNIDFTVLGSQKPIAVGKVATYA